MEMGAGKAAAADDRALSPPLWAPRTAVLRLRVALGLRVGVDRTDDDLGAVQRQILVVSTECSPFWSTRLRGAVAMGADRSEGYIVVRFMS
jgi:hypothetical protein